MGLFSTNKVKCADDLDEAKLAQLEDIYRMEDAPGAEPGPPGRKPTRVPPAFDNYMGAIRAITKKQEHIKGFRFEFGLPCSQNFQMIHTWNIPNYEAKPRQSQGAYTFSGQYVHLNLPTNPAELQMMTEMPSPKFIMTGRMESTGKLEAAIIKPLGDKINIRLTSQYQNSDVNYAQMHLDVDYEGDDYTHTFKYGSGMWGFNFMQTIGRSLVAGFELLNLTERKQSLMSGGFRYAHRNKHSLYFNYLAMTDTATIAYLLKINKNSQAVTELSLNTADGETKFITGYRQRFQSTDVIATISNKGKISSALNINGGLYQLKLCCVADYSKDTYKFGYGISFGQTQ
jgi:mitochondrial import receptor subunit TOM40